jgi:hypothetical protein
VLLASVKDGARFDGGWGFFDFTAGDGGITVKAQPSADSAGCRTCHVEEAETDSVFTQLYSALRTRQQDRLRDEVSRRTAGLVQPSQRVVAQS